MIGIRESAAIVLVLVVSGCKVGPNYKRPVLSVPDQYRGVAPGLQNQPLAEPFAEMNWETVFKDETLQALIKEALTNNYDMQIPPPAFCRPELLSESHGPTNCRQSTAPSESTTSATRLP